MSTNTIYTLRPKSYSDTGTPRTSTEKGASETPLMRTKSEPSLQKSEWFSAGEVTIARSVSSEIPEEYELMPDQVANLFFSKENKEDTLRFGAYIPDSYKTPKAYEAYVQQIKKIVGGFQSDGTHTLSAAVNLLSDNPDKGFVINVNQNVKILLTVGKNKAGKEFVGIKITTTPLPLEGFVDLSTKEVKQLFDMEGVSHNKESFLQVCKNQANNISHYNKISLSNEDIKISDEIVDSALKNDHDLAREDIGEFIFLGTGQDQLKPDGILATLYLDNSEEIKARHSRYQEIPIEQKDLIRKKSSIEEKINIHIEKEKEEYLTQLHKHKLLNYSSSTFLRAPLKPSTRSPEISKKIKELTLKLNEINQKISSNEEEMKNIYVISDRNNLGIFNGPNTLGGNYTKNINRGVVQMLSHIRSKLDKPFITIRSAGHSRGAVEASAVVNIVQDLLFGNLSPEKNEALRRTLTKHLTPDEITQLNTLLAQLLSLDDGIPPIHFRILSLDKVRGNIFFSQTASDHHQYSNRINCLRKKDEVIEEVVIAALNTGDITQNSIFMDPTREESPDGRAFIRTTVLPLKHGYVDKFDHTPEKTSHGRQNSAYVVHMIENFFGRNISGIKDDSFESPHIKSSEILRSNLIRGFNLVEENRANPKEDFTRKRGAYVNTYQGEIREEFLHRPKFKKESDLPKSSSPKVDEANLESIPSIEPKVLRAGLAAHRRRSTYHDKENNHPDNGVAPR